MQPRSRRSQLGIVTIVASMVVILSTAEAEQPENYLGHGSRHRILSGDMPPGAVGQARLAGRGPVAGYYQPVLIRGPQQVGFAMPNGGTFPQPSSQLEVGLLIGGVYRFRITNIPGAEGAEIYPTIELVDRTYPPPGLAYRYPITIDLDQEDLQAALDGQMVTRVIYLEDPQTATPIVQSPETIRPYEISGHQDALEVADRLGRPLAIVRIGSVSPPQAPALLPQFFFGYPSWIPFERPEHLEHPQHPQP